MQVTEQQVGELLRRSGLPELDESQQISCGWIVLSHTKYEEYPVLTISCAQRGLAGESWTRDEMTALIHKCEGVLLAHGIASVFNSATERPYSSPFLVIGNR